MILCCLCEPEYNFTVIKNNISMHIFTKTSVHKNCHMETPENTFEQQNISVHVCACGIESLKSTV